MGRVTDMTMESRAKVRALIERETIRTGSKMCAYEIVAQMVGRSPEWLRAFANNYPNGKLDCTILNIDEAYRRAGHADGAS